MKSSETVFYSWQSTLPNNLNRSFIEKALRDAINDLSSEMEIIEAIRDKEIALDKDTQGMSGSPPIVDAIFNKIKSASAFVADVSYVCINDEGKCFPNSNVLIEKIKGSEPFLFFLD